MGTSAYGIVSSNRNSTAIHVAVARNLVHLWDVGAVLWTLDFELVIVF